MTDITVAPAADAEETAFAAGLADSTLADATFSDDLFARCRDAIIQAAPAGAATHLDIAVLIRQVLRRGSERDGVPFRLLVGATGWGPAGPRTWRSVGVATVPASEGKLLLSAEPYVPSWLEASVPVDAAAVAGTHAGRRASYTDIRADPFFAEATTYPTYKTPGQRSAVRAAVSMPDGGTLIAELPTGTGKTEIAVSLAHISHGQTVIIVVPTVALAYDFERRFQELHARRRGRVGNALAFAWTGDTDLQTRERLRSDLVRGEIPLLVTSPESLGGALHSSLMEAAGAGRVAALVIDEAHLVTQWGYDFRPEFRELATLRQDVLAASANGGHAPLKTVLLSATLGPDELTDLTDLFGRPGPVSLIAANMLRPEPDYWIAPWCPPHEREAHVLEALRRLPRPLVLYATRPEQAADWCTLIKEEGFGRAAVVTGETAGESRRDVLEGMRAGRDRVSRYDIVIATSAFGLGIDYQGIRTVIHACLPETVDRWYQEVGRGGRDGDASTALLLPAFGDERIAASLGVTTLTPETAAERWQDLWGRRRQIEARSFIDLHRPPPDVASGSYNHRWNSQLVRGLEELRQIRRRAVSPWEAEDLGLTWSPRDHDWEEVELLSDETHAADFFERTWVPWRDKATAPVIAALDAMKLVLRPGTSVCAVISKAYAPDDRIWDRFGAAAATLEPEAGCGRCPRCRELQIMPQTTVPPQPGGAWATDVPVSEALAALLDACPSARRVAVLTDEEPIARARSLAPLLWDAGVRYFAGLRDWQPGRPGHWAFIDEALDYPFQAPPLPAFVVPHPDALASGQWLIPEARPQDKHGEPHPLVLLVGPGARIGGQPRARQLRTLRATTAERILNARPA